VEFDGSRLWADINTASVIPALSGVEDNRRTTLLWIRDQDIHLADFYTFITSAAQFRVKR